MAEQIIAQEDLTSLEVLSTGGNLYLVGWNRDDIRIKEISDQDSVRKKKNLLSLTMAGDAYVHIPHSLTAKIQSVGGDASLRGIRGELEISSVGGDLSLIDVGSVTVDLIGGDLTANRVQGDLRVKNTGGDGFAENIKGQISLQRIGGDAYLEKIGGGIELLAGGEARLSFHPVPWQAYHVKSGGDISATIPDETPVDLTITSEAKDITVIVGDIDLKLKEKKFHQQIGEGGPDLQLHAGGKVFLSGDEFNWLKNLKLNADEFEDLAVDFSAQTADQIRSHFSHLENDLNKSLSGLSDSLESIGISEENLQRLASQIEEASRDTAKKAEIAAVKAQAKVEKKFAIARKQAMKIKSKAKEFDLDRFLKSRDQKQSISADERMLILNMLQEKKISPEEADNLLQALEGKKKP